MSNVNHLFRRDAVYYWRGRLPRPVGRILGRTHFVRSLRTREPDRARRLARRFSAVVEEMADTLRGSEMGGLNLPTPQDLDRILLDLFTEVLETGEVIRAARPKGTSPWTIDGDASEEEQELQEAAADPDIGWNWRTHLRHNILDPVIPAVERMLKERNLRPLKDETEWHLFLRKAMATVGAALDIESEREQGIYRAPVHPFVSVNNGPAIGVGGVGAEAAREKVSEMFEKNIATKEGEGRWKETSGTARQARVALRLFLAFKSDMPFAQVQKADAFGFREWLCSLPALVGKSIYTELDYPKAIKLRKAVAADLKKLGPSTNPKEVVTVGGLKMTRAEAEERAKPMSKKTVNKHLTFFTDAFGQRILRSGYPMANPFTGVLFAKQDVAKGSNTRELWEVDELSRLFQLPVWGGCVGPHNRVTPKESGYLADDGKFWIPLIGLFTGMRESEIAMLDVSDVAWNEETKSWLFLVAQETGAGKTKAAQRRIPVHPILEQIGLIEFRNTMEAKGHVHLFPDLRQKKKPGQAFGKWFREYLTDLGLYQRWRDFHSLRHTFKTRLIRQLKAHPLMVGEVMGHRKTDEMDIVYFHGFEPTETVPTLRALSYDGLDLSHLFRSAQPNRTIPEKFEWVDQDGGTLPKPEPQKPKAIRIRPAKPKIELDAKGKPVKRILVPGKLRGGADG